MLTIFSLPKAFEGHIGRIQTNALLSWRRLDPPCEIILFGEEAGTQEAAEQFSVRHIPKVEVNEYGTPLMDDLFEKAQISASYGWLCYVNADIILMNDFMQAVEQAKIDMPCFLLAGRRWNVDLDQSWDLTAPGFESRLREDVSLRGELFGIGAIDYFVFPKGALGRIPPFAIGRFGWDNWLIWRARSLGLPVVDATRVVMAVHQNHGYSYGGNGKKSVVAGPESKRNKRLAGHYLHCFTLLDSTHVLSPSGLKSSWIWHPVSHARRCWWILTDRLSGIRLFFDPVKRMVTQFGRLFTGRRPRF